MLDQDHPVLGDSGNKHRRPPLWAWIALGMVVVGAATAAVLLLPGGDGSDGTGTQPPGTVAAPSTPAEAPEPPQQPGSDAPADSTAGLKRLSEIESLIRPNQPGDWWCPEDRPVGYGSAFTCQLTPPPGYHTEVGNTIVVVLDDEGHYAVDPSHNCCGDPQISDYPVGAFCRDLNRAYQGPPGPPGGGLSYVEALYYWYLEGRPSRMDADRDGIPCETVYPADEIAATWGGHLPPEDPVFADVVQIADVLPQLRAELEAAYGPGSIPFFGDLHWRTHIDQAGEIVPLNAATPTSTFYLSYMIEVDRPGPSPYEGGDIVVTVHDNGGFDWAETG